MTGELKKKKIAKSGASSIHAKRADSSAYHAAAYDSAKAKNAVLRQGKGTMGSSAIAKSRSGASSAAGSGQMMKKSTLRKPVTQSKGELNRGQGVSSGQMMMKKIRKKKEA